MPVFNMMFPVLPGKEQDARKFAEEAMGSHRQQFESVQKVTSTARETWAMQETPAGTFMLVWGEGDDVESGFERMATASGEDFDWMRGRIKEVSGIDMTEPGGLLPEVILDWSA